MPAICANLVLTIFLSTFLFKLEHITCAIRYQKVVTGAGATVFEALDENKLEIPNTFRQFRNKEANPPYLKLSLHSAKILEVVQVKNDSIWQLKLSDNTRVDIKVDNKTANNVIEYLFHWHSNAQLNEHELCVHYGFNDAAWYSTHQSADQQWPMNTSKISSNWSNFNNLLTYDNFNNPPGEFFFLLEHLFLNSDGFAILPDEAQPLFIRRDNYHEDQVLCFASKAQVPYASDVNDPSYKDIKVRMFASSNVRSVTDYVVHSSGYILKPAAIPEDLYKFQYPTSFINYPKQEDIVQFVDKLEKNGLVHGEIIYNGAWSNGDLVFNKTRFPNVDSLVSRIRSKGYRFTIELQPSLKTDHDNLKKYFLNDSSDKQTNWLDFTWDQTADWFQLDLKRMCFENDIHSLMTYFPAMRDMKGFHNLKTPNLYVKNYLKSVSGAGNLTTWFAFKSQNLPIFTQLTIHDRTDQKTVLTKLIPTVLSASIGGYSFISPPPVGFDLSKKDEEMFIRWLQIVTLMPNMSFFDEIFQWDLSANTLNMVKKFVTLHEEHSQTIIDLAKKRVSDGSPIVRPLWYTAPDDPKTYRINDQFMLGEDILVAPVVVLGQRERTVYLPTGTWIDQHGVTRDGPMEAKIHVPLEELPYFKRKL